MTTYEFLMWRRYYGERPFGEAFIDYRDALSVKQLLAPHTKSDIPLNDLLLVRPDLEEKKQDLLKVIAAFEDETHQYKGYKRFYKNAEVNGATKDNKEALLHTLHRMRVHLQGYSFILIGENIQPAPKSLC